MVMHICSVLKGVHFIDDQMSSIIKAHEQCKYESIQMENKPEQATPYGERVYKFWEDETRTYPNMPPTSCHRCICTCSSHFMIIYKPTYIQEQNREKKKICLGIEICAILCYVTSLIVCPTQIPTRYSRYLSMCSVLYTET